MIKVEYLIIGGGVAGTTAAETIRQHQPNATIVIVSDEPYRLYSRIMLSKPGFFLGQTPFDQVFLKTLAWYTEHTIDLQTGHAATALDSVRKVVTLDDGRAYEYQKLLLAIGTDVVRWAIPGANLPGIHYLRNLKDAKGIIADVKSTRHAVVIGGGFVGFEMCDMLRQAGLETTLIIRERYFWEPVLDETSGRLIEAALEKGGVKIIRETLVDKVEGETHVDGLQLSTGRSLPCDMVMLGIGTHSHVEWVAQAGIACDQYIRANEYLETSAPNVWTAGDVAEYHDVILDEDIRLGNWTNALMQGRIAALNMIGQRQPYKLVSFYTAHGLGMGITFVGDVRLTEKTTVIPRGTSQAGHYGRIILKGDRIVGATMVNRTQDLAPLTKIIERGVSIASVREKLGDPTFDLQSIVSAPS